MIDENELCLQLRNKTTRAEETYCKYYLKNFRGYLKSVFLNVQFIGLLLMALFSVLVITLLLPQLMENDDDIMPWIIMYTFLGVSLFFLIYIPAQKLWFWKYAKYVVVTNEGIWIMWFSTFWWSEDFTGKKRFWSPSWSFYGWNEIKITAQRTSLFLTRWDGVQQIDFLEESDANEILAYAKEQQKRKKRKKKDMEIIEEEYDKIPDEDYVEHED